jgi:hypothetical protein
MILGTEKEFYRIACEVEQGDILTDKRWPSLQLWHAGIFKDKTRNYLLILLRFSEEFNRGSSQKLKNSAGDQCLLFLMYELMKGCPIPPALGSSEMVKITYASPIGDASPMSDISEF